MSIKRLNVGKRLSEIVVHGNTVYLAGEVPDDATLDITGYRQSQPTRRNCRNGRQNT